MQSTKLRHKINGAILATFISIAVTFAGILLPFQQQRFDTVMKKIELLLQTLVERDRNHLGDELLDGRIRAVNIRLDQMMKVDGILSISIFDQQGKRIAAAGAAPDQADLTPADMTGVVGGVQSRSKTVDGQSALLYFQELRIIGERIGFIRIYYSIEDVKQEQRQSFFIFSGLLFSILMTMIVLLNLILSKMIVNPVRSLQEAAGLIAHGRLDEFIDTSRKDEIGKLAGSFMQMRDAIRKQINDLQVLNREIEAKNKELKKADRLKDEFLSNTSHELRTPLTGINGIAESLLDGAAGPLNADQRENLKLIASSGRRLASLVNDILDFSRLKNRNIDLSLKPVDLKSIAELVLTLSLPMAQAKGLTLGSRIPEDIPPVYADENRLEQILHNLVGNAVKFTEKGAVTIHAKQDAEMLSVTVSDTGIGIAADKFPSIFKSFEQADGSTARKFGGTGLGLSITKKLVELHGGWIEVASTLGKGANLTFTLPVSRKKTEPFRAMDILKKSERLNRILAPPMKTEAGGGAETPVRRLKPSDAAHHILVVDDEPVNLRVLQNQLAADHYAVTTASNGAEALAAVENEGTFSLVLLYVMMPGITGYDVCRRIRERYQANDLPVLMLTARNQIEDLVAGLKAGANDYLVKPFSKEELLARIETHLNLKALTAETVRLEVARKAAESASKAKSEFLSNMSHELRTPLNAILGFSQMIQRDRTLADRHREQLAIIRRSGEHLTSLINNVLDISKIEAGRMALNNTYFNLHHLLDDVKDMMRLKAEKKSLTLNVVKRPELPVRIKADEIKLRQILINLIGNGIKFTQHGGVTVRAGAAPGTEAGHKNTLSFEVSDTGPGIAPEETADLFEPFVQTETGLQSREGTGLGLAISRKFVRLMGGDIQVRGRPGEGSAFFFDIQFQSADKQDMEEISTSRMQKAVSIENGQPSYKLLIVDNRRDNRLLLKEFLEPFGFELREAENGREAVGIWRAWRPHLIWMDIKMPVMNGYEAVKKIRVAEAAGSERRTVIIALTASSLEQDHAFIRDADFDDYLRKPYSEDEIFDVLNKSLGVQFIYESKNTEGGERRPKETIAPETLTALPAACLAELEQGAEVVDFDLLYSTVERIRSYDAAAADVLMALLEKYDYDGILQLVRKK